MAFFNSVRLYARVMQDAIVRTNAADVPVAAQLYVCVLKSRRSYGDRSEKFMQYEAPLVMSWDPMMIAKMASLHRNDIVDIAGYFSTVDVPKRVRCPDCGEIIEKPGVVSYVNPTFLMTRKTGLTEEESLREIIDNAEISNVVELFGRLTEDPKEIIFRPGTSCTKYTLGVKRLKFFSWEPPERTVDYPVIRSYGDLGVENLVSLHGPGTGQAGEKKKGSEVKIDGFIQARQVMQKSTCPSCGHDFQWPDWAMEVVPFNTEYARDCIIPGSAQTS